MGWAYCGKDYFGREIGYGIQATCDKRGCDIVIDRGLGSICGDMHHGPFSDERGCGKYFCDTHLGGWPGPRGGCIHRQRKVYGVTFCQLMGYGGQVDRRTGAEVFVSFGCACAKWSYDGPTDGMTLDRWRDIPGYLDHLRTSLLVTDMKQSGEEWAYA